MLGWFALLMVALTGMEAAALHWGWATINAWRQAPRVAFEAIPALPADAYANSAMWIARPDLPTDPARDLPPGIAHERQGRAMVFFLHPTTFMARNHWNAPIAYPNAQMRAELAVQQMASVFNDEAGIYAPRYRQAALGSFVVDRPESRLALALAERDARAAFATFLQAIPPTGPIVLAAHGQGTLILMHLIRDMVRGTPFEARVIAVYLAGWPVSATHDLPRLGMPACARADQTGCVLGWLTFATPGDPRGIMTMASHYPALDGVRAGVRGRDRPLCINPLTGDARADAPASDNFGSLATGDELRRPALVRPSVGARCDGQSGMLMVTDPPHLGDDVRPVNDYTAYDFALFWRNLRNDVARRETAWLQEHAAVRHQAG
jgi:hypothetical protein